MSSRFIESVLTSLRGSETGGRAQPIVVLRYAAVLAGALLLAGCATLRIDVERLPSQAWPRPEDTTLGRGAIARLAASPGDSGFLLLDSGMDALTARAALAEAAERTLDLQYYIVRESATTQLLIYRVLRAADRGVRVRLLVDDLSAAGKELHLDELAAHPNVQVRVFNPFLFRDPLGLTRFFEFVASAERLNRRMHNKVWIADNAAAVVGGRNLGDEYFGADPALNFADLDVFAVGPVVRELSRSFDAYWSSESAVPIEAFVTNRPSQEQVAQFGTALAQRVDQFRDTGYAQALREARFGRQLRQFEMPLAIAPAEVIYDDPTKPVPPGGEVAASAVSPRIHPHVESAEREVILISPYFIPSERSVATLTGLAKRGVRVRVLTNSLASTDVPAAHAGYARYRATLIAGGVEMFEMRPLPQEGDTGNRFGSSGASLHAKAIVVDRRFVALGSMNLDPRSRRHNTELAVLIESAELAKRVADLFGEGVQPARAYQVELADPNRVDAGLVWITEGDGKPVRYTSEPASFGKRLSAGLLSIFAPEDML
jgi:putative cardiolipin synthase